MINTTDDAKKIRWVMAYAAVYLIRYGVGLAKNMDNNASVVDRIAISHASQIFDTVENKLKAR